MPCFCASTMIYRSNCITRENSSFRGYNGAFAPLAAKMTDDK